MFSQILQANDVIFYLNLSLWSSVSNDRLTGMTISSVTCSCPQFEPPSSRPRRSCWWRHLYTGSILWPFSSCFFLFLLSHHSSSCDIAMIHVSKCAQSEFSLLYCVCDTLVFFLFLGNFCICHYVYPADLSRDKRIKIINIKHCMSSLA